MPVHIMELVIKAKVGDEQSSGNNTEALNGTGGTELDRQKMAYMEKLVEETLDIVKRKNER